MTDQPSPYDPGSKPPRTIVGVDLGHPCGDKTVKAAVCRTFPPCFPSGIDWPYIRQAAIDRINSQPDPLVADLVAIIDEMLLEPSSASRGPQMKTDQQILDEWADSFPRREKDADKSPMLSLIAIARAEQRREDAEKIRLAANLTAHQTAIQFAALASELLNPKETP